MTAENDGTGATPEGDDPFAYLYRGQGGDGSTASQPQPGAPRRSYNQVRTVGERQYGGGYGGQPSAHYAAPETMPGGRAATRQAPGPQGGDGYGGYDGEGADGYSGHGGRSRNGLLIGALAVVAAVVVGIGAAIYFNNDGKDGAKAGDSSGSAAGGKGGQQNKPGPAGKLRKGKLVSKQDAARLSLAGGAATATDVPNAQGAGGAYIGGMNAQGASATWTIGNVPKSGQYTLFVRYGVPGADANSTLSVNGTALSHPLNMSNFAHAQQGDWAKGWTKTFAWVQLKKGQNDVKISCEQGNQCNFNLDQVSLKAGKVRH